MKGNMKTIILYLVIIVAMISVCFMFINNKQEQKEITFGEAVELFKDNKVVEFTITSSNVLKITTTDTTETGTAVTCTHKLRDVSLFMNTVDEYVQAQLALPKEERTLKIEKWDVEAIKETSSWLLAFLPGLIIAVLLIVFYIFMMNKAGDSERRMNSFGKARVKIPSKDKNRKFFSDVAGCDEEKEELREVVDYLKDPAKFRRLGAKIPHGVLLVGPPGTGKTLLAKAVAGEADVPFFSISGSDFVEMYVGVGASRVRDLFETAKKAPASIIFIDEIDAVGRRRGTGLGGGHDEKEQTLNQLLVEMDGFGGHDGVIVIAATNRPDILDPALLRPGRFDRQVTVGYPDIKGREEILKVHAKDKPLESDVDLAKIAQTTVGFAGADLANLLNEAALLAARKNKSLIGMVDIEESWIKIAVGKQKRNYKIKPQEKLKTAYHEAGHAILAYFLPTQDPVRQISIIPSGRALGYTLNPPVEDKYSVYKNEMKENIAVFLAGRAAEEIVFGDVSGGASNDIQRATRVARDMVMVYGMSDVLGTVHLGNEHGDDEVFLGRDFNSSKGYSEQTAALIDSEIKRIIDEAYAKAKEVLTMLRDKLDFVAEFLVAHEIMDDEQFRAAMEADAPTVAEIAAIGEERRRRSEEENKLREAAEAEARKKDEEEAKRRAEAEKVNQQRGYGYDDPYDPHRR
ncbi:MAG: ATP-dependent zinc metalloprotease FtsH [Clostridia bacterium]|nr:ATP-dependent zinc metalloprotease FtsH [Clostridia bacterium]